ncbi:hypothetical protein [Aurantimonas sp. A3-2-R12]|uniref:hypothetical protein n=1 Tax=Aurantimonas sp. A3-2-R12 TaxID=3114362 RepID=UPI002E17FAEA|nr:hypothetical protein [Aurantimonas sp. A3-2-R12]
MYQDLAAQALTAQIGVETDEDRQGSAFRPLLLTADPDTGPAARTALVFFPVVLRGDGGPVIPFGRYDLMLPEYTSWSWGKAPRQAVLVSRDGGAHIVLSTQQLDAFTQDPDVEII